MANAFQLQANYWSLSIYISIINEAETAANIYKESCENVWYFRSSAC